MNNFAEGLRCVVAREEPMLPAVGRTTVGARPSSGPTFPYSPKPQALKSVVQITVCNK